MDWQEAWNFNPLSAILSVSWLPYDTKLYRVLNFGTGRFHLNFGILDEKHQWKVNWCEKCLLTLISHSPSVWHPAIIVSQEELALRGLTFHVGWWSRAHYAPLHFLHMWKSHHDIGWAVYIMYPKLPAAVTDHSYFSKLVWYPRNMVCAEYVQLY